MEHTIDSQYPVGASEATEDGAHRSFTLLARTYNELLSLLCGYDPSLVGATTLLVHHMDEAEVLKHVFSEMQSLLSTELTAHELARHLAKHMRTANPGNESLDSCTHTAHLVAIASRRAPRLSGLSRRAAPYTKRCCFGAAGRMAMGRAPGTPFTFHSRLRGVGGRESLPAKRRW